DEINPQLESYHNEEVELQSTIMNSAPSIQLKNEYKKLVKDIEGLQQRRNEKIKVGLLSGFGKNYYNYIASVMATKSAASLSDIKESDKEIPVGIEAKSINYLLKRGKCICGEPLIPGDTHFRTVEELLDIVPPKTIGTLSAEVKSKNKSVQRNSVDFYEKFRQEIIELRDLDNRISDMQRNAADRFARLSDTTEGEKARKRKEEIRKEYNRLNEEKIRKTSIIAMAKEKAMFDGNMSEQECESTDKHPSLIYCSCCDKLFSCVFSFSIFLSFSAISVFKLSISSRYLSTSRSSDSSCNISLISSSLLYFA
ncbi:MAG: hypothetical protein K6B68_18465, partial [Eubacterium sp.]|nr:hypothetical protein [Eubacterium sp.]